MERQLSRDFLRKYFHYDLITGIFTRLLARRENRVGTRAGSVMKNGYRVININGRLYTEHRLAWFYICGKWPKNIDHKNGMRNDNRFENLREASRSQNMMNGFLRNDNQSGFKGVCKSNNKWRATINKDGKQFHLGYFDSAEKAHFAYANEAEKLFGQFARV